MYKRIGYFKRRGILKNANFLDLTPLPQHPHQLDDQGLVQVLAPRFTSFLTKKFLQPKAPSPHIVLSLDENGSAVWLLCDGNHDVRTICNILEEQLGPKIHPVKDRVTRFLAQLYKDNLIIFREIIKHNNHDQSIERPEA
ncbi:MAG: PqqD family protein [Bacteroidales bacterium]